MRYASYHAHNVRRVLQIPNEVGACAVDIARTESQSLDAARQDRYRMRICQPSKWGPLMTATAAYEEVDAEESLEREQVGLSPSRWNRRVPPFDQEKGRWWVREPYPSAPSPIITPTPTTRVRVRSSTRSMGAKYSCRFGILSSCPTQTTAGSASYCLAPVTVGVNCNSAREHSADGGV